MNQSGSPVVTVGAKSIMTCACVTHSPAVCMGRYPADLSFRIAAVSSRMVVGGLAMPASSKAFLL
ncbi:hypothetical protein RKD48_007242 [Streptomyces ambofaciens]